MRDDNDTTTPVPTAGLYCAVLVDELVALRAVEVVARRLRTEDALKLESALAVLDRVRVRSGLPAR